MALLTRLLVVALFTAFPAFAQEGGSISVGLGAIGMGLAGLGAAVGIGILAGRLLEAIARQPELEGKLMPKFFLAAGLTDAVPFIALVLSFLVVLGVF